MLRGISHVRRNLNPSEPLKPLGGQNRYLLNLWTDADSQIKPRSNSAVASFHSIELSLKSGIKLEQNDWCKIWLT